MTLMAHDAAGRVAHALGQAVAKSARRDVKRGAEANHLNEFMFKAYHHDQDDPNLLAGMPTSKWPSWKRKMALNERETRNLFRRFAAPLAPYAATSQARKELGEVLAKCLWAAMIGGPVMEEETWQTLQSMANLDSAALQAIKVLYFREMKPIVSDEELAMLREAFFAHLLRTPWPRKAILPSRRTRSPGRLPNGLPGLTSE